LTELTELTEFLTGRHEEEGREILDRRDMKDMKGRQEDFGWD